LIEVIVKKNNVERALRELKRKVKDTGLLWELSEKRFYTKPSVKKRQKKLKAKLRMKRNTIKSEKSY
jgi:small subunit ribosomal protein S21